MSGISKVVVLCGGNSAEREVSIKSGERITEALRRRGYRAILIDPCKEYGGITYADIFTHQPIPISVSQKEKIVEFTASSLEICRNTDVVFLALHGGAGENGMLAAALECHGIRHTGSRFKGMCLSMDKLISKTLIKQANLDTPEYVFLPSEAQITDTSPFIPAFPPPYVIKPVDGGSSIGIRIAANRKELEAVLDEYPTPRPPLLIERAIRGREFTVGILNGSPLAVTEIIPHSGFYDYENKYIKGRTEEITPASITPETEKRLKNAAIRTHDALFLHPYSRIDMILESDTDRIYVLEANALPGMTETSLLPQGAKAIGLDFDTLCEAMLLSAE